MSDDRETVRNISWRNLFPWLMIFRTFGISIAMPVLFLATLGALLTPVGWRAGEWLFVQEEVVDKNFHEVIQRNGRWAWQRRNADRHSHQQPPTTKPAFPVAAQAPSIFQEFVDPYRQIFQTGLSLTHFAYFLFGGLWTLLVWAFFGGAITRLATMQLGCEERIGLKEALVHAKRKVVQYFLAPLAPLLLITLITLPMVLLGFFISTGDWGIVMAGVTWLLVLLGSFVSAVLLLGLLFGWPLMWGTISSEGTDAFDALSRSYAYTFQRPLHYLFYAGVAALFGLLTWTLVHFFSEKVVDLAYWGISWGMSPSRLAEVRNFNPQAQNGLWFGTGLIQIFNGLIWTIAVAFRYSFFWCAATAIYLLLRKDVDQAEFDEIYVEEEGERYGLPPMVTDDQGVPDLAEKPAADASPAEDPSPENNAD